MARVIRFPQAERDITDIWFYLVREWGRERADAFLDHLEQKLNLLAEHPHMGRSRDELKPGLRSYPIGQQLAFYYPFEEGIELVRLLDGRRDIPTIFGER
jgi:toxin ParE1/3/4